MRRWGVLGFIGLVACAVVFKQRMPAVWPDFYVPAESVPLELGPAAEPVSLYRSEIVTEGVTPEVHCASLVESPNGLLQAFWYGGAREGARDVAIYSSVLSSEISPHSSVRNAQSRWQAQTPVVTREQTQKELKRYIKKIGNPVAIVDQRSRLWLFFVSVSVGGWAGSAVNYQVSSDFGQTWSQAQRLVISPFHNLSTLVKDKPFVYEDGSLGLPIYHEFIGKFAELLRVDPVADLRGHIRGKARLTSGRDALQPVILPESADAAVAYLRSSNKATRRVLVTQSLDRGARWQSPQVTNLPNPDAAISAVRLASGAILMVFNNSELSRHNLSLAYAPAVGEPFVWLFDFEKSSSTSDHDYASYPFLLQARNGHFHLLYTSERQRIKHVEFNDAWLQAHLRAVALDKPMTALVAEQAAEHLNAVHP